MERWSSRPSEKRPHEHPSGCRVNRVSLELAAAPRICFDPHAGQPIQTIVVTVEDIEAEVRRLTASGIALRNEIMEFHDRKLVFLSGPEGVTVEFAQWLKH
jgi:hypothetical protein